MEERLCREVMEKVEGKERFDPIKEEHRRVDQWLKELAIASKTSAQIESIHQYQTKAFIGIGVLHFLFGLLLPHDWREMLGILAEPIMWVATHIPSIERAASVSPISELVQGFFGIAFLFLPLFCIIVFWHDPLGVRFKDGMDLEKSRLRFFVLTYLVGVPFFSLMFYLILFLPGDMYLGTANTRGQALFFLMISYRFALALIGSLLMMGACAMLWVMAVMLVGPLFYFFERMNHRDKSVS